MSAGTTARTDRPGPGRAATTLDGKVAAAGTVLTGARGLLAASRATGGPAAFERFAEVELENSEMLSLNWAPRVSAAARGGFERASGRPITETDGSGALRAAGARPEYYPLLLVAPGTLAARAARDGGRPVITQALTLDSGGVPTRVALLAVVYGPDPQPASTRARRAQLRGFTGGIFGIAGLADSALAILPPGSRLQIVSAGARVFDSGDGAMPGPTAEARVGTTAWSVRVALDRLPCWRSRSWCSPEARWRLRCSSACSSSRQTGAAARARTCVCASSTRPTPTA